ncbi:MAG: phage recombination protein Bet [Bacteroidota bacterium]
MAVHVAAESKIYYQLPGQPSILIYPPLLWGGGLKKLVMKEIAKITDDQLQTLARAGVIPENTPAPQVKVFAQICRSKGLDPFTKQIHLVQHGNRYTPIVGIDGRRSLAARTGLHAGTDEAKFNLQPDGKYHTAAQLQGAGKLPTTATVTVWKIVGGHRAPFTHTAVLQEFSTGKQKWATMPFQMLSKAAETHALNKAFPDEMSGLHIEAELGAIEDAQVPTAQVDPQVQIISGAADHVGTILKSLDGETQSRFREILRSQWKSEDFRQPIVDKFAAGELDETFLTNYLEDQLVVDAG